MKLRSVIAASLLVACAPMVRNVEPVTTVVGIDFRGVAAGDFFFSPDAYVGSHEPLGLIFVTSQAGATYAIRDSTAYVETWIVGEITIDSVLTIAKRWVVEMGGDGLVNLKLAVAPRHVSAYLVTPGWELSGLAIKRLRP